MLILSTSATDGNCCSSILPNNSSGHYKKASTTALQIVIANFRCVLSSQNFDISVAAALQFIYLSTFLVASWLHLLTPQVSSLYCPASGRLLSQRLA